MYDILGCEQQQGDQDAAGFKEPGSLRLHNDVHKVMAMTHVFMPSGGIPMICVAMFTERPPMSGVFHLAICHLCVMFLPSASRTTTTAAPGRASFFASWLFSIPCSGIFLRFEAPACRRLRAYLASQVPPAPAMAR
jgi:hypothetical protein